MERCARCGREPGAGPACGHCGQPVNAPLADDWRTGTAERPAVRPRSPLPSPVPPAMPPRPRQPPPPPPRRAVQPPPAPPRDDRGPRFPLYADEAGPPTPTRTAELRSVQPRTAPPRSREHRAHRRPWSLWLAASLALVLVAAAGLWLVLGTRGEDPSAAADPHTASDRAPGASRAQRKPTPERAAPGTGPVAELADTAAVTVPTTAAPNEDVQGNRVDYDGANLLDGVPATSWRMPGDGTGAELVVQLPERTRLSRVGLVNGYAKTALDAQGRELDWYHGNRRALAVVWTFDDGSTVKQDLTDTRAPQTVEVDVTTSSVRLRLARVSLPGTGPASRDYTALSDVTLVGSSG
jgi:hypothetical protein